MAGLAAPKHKQIYQTIHQGILTGTYGAGQRIPTEAELAKVFKTSRVTVARALHDLETEGYLIRRRRAGSFVRLRENETAGLVGLVSGPGPGIPAKISNSMVNEAHAKGLSLLSTKWPDGDGQVVEAYAEELCTSYLARKIAGIFWVPSGLPDEQASVNNRIAEILSRHAMPVVLLDRDICDSPRRSRFDLVGIDNFHAGYILTEHLWSLGRRRIVFISDLQTVSTVSVRIAGYRFALDSYGANPVSDWVQRGDTSDVEFVRGLFDGIHPDGLVCVNDRVAAQLIRTLTVLGVQVPDDVGIVSIDDDQWATYLSTPLTTLRQPSAELGAAAIKVMMERLADPRMPAREVCLTCNLIVRESCGGAKKIAGAASGLTVRSGTATSSGEPHGQGSAG